MDHDPEVIRKEMQETRSSITEKIEALGQQLVGTVHDAREAVKETVDTVKGAVTDTVSTVKEQVTGTVTDVKQTVTGTVTDVKQTFGHTVDSVKETFDVERQVINHPWLMVGGAVCLGYVSGVMLHRMSPPARRRFPDFPPPRPSAPVARADEWTSTRSAGASAAAAAAPVAQSFQAVAPAAPQEPGAMAQLLKTFEPEIQQLKAVAIGAMFGIIRDMVQKNLPPNLTEPVTNVVDNLTTKLGGQPVQGHILETGPDGR